MKEQILEWLDVAWFDQELITQTYEYERPLFLYLAVALPLVVWLFGLVSLFWQRKLLVSGPPTDVFTSPLAILAAVPWLFFGGTLALICFSLARPQKSDESGKTTSQGVDIMMVMDISSSMVDALDFKPNRLEKTKVLASQFVEGRVDDNVGMVVFAGEAFVKSPPTQDKELLQNLIEDLRDDEVNVQGTAIGSGAALAVSLLKESKSKSKLLIVISDGDNNAGSIDPLQAAALADAYGIKIYAIGVGKKGMIPYRASYKTFFGKEVESITQVENTFDETQLKAMAKSTNGEYFRATSGGALKKIFEKIDQLEKTKIESERFKYKTDFYHIYLFWAVVFFLVFVLLRSTFMVNLLKD